MLNIGDLVDGKYRVLSEVGHGGMSTVYLARNERANKNWAIKELRKNGTSQYDVVKQNLIAETEILKRLSNPHLPSIVDVIDSDDTFVIVMDFVEGNSLEKTLQKGPVPEKDVVNWGRQLCDVLIYLHSRKPPIIYRDMKPSNVILRPDGVIVLLDFGTAREYKSRRAGDDTTCLGTRGYAAPEQYGGMGQTDGRTDIYCLGATLYHLVTGMNPGLPPYEMKPIRQVNRALSDGLEKIILKCTRPNPNERYQTCEELKFDLEHVEELGRKAQNRRSKRITAFLCAVALCLAGTAGAVAFRVAAGNETRTSYDYYLAQGNGSATLDERLDFYTRAVKVAPERADAYDDLRQYAEQDNNIDAGEIEALQTLLGTLVSNHHAEEYFEGRNREAYERFAYGMGLDYYLYCENNGKSLAGRWLQAAAESETLPSAEKEIAQKLFTISEARASVNKKVNAEYTYAQYWEELRPLVQENLAANTGYYIALGIYRFIAGDIRENYKNFERYDIPRSDLETALDTIEKGVLDIKTDESNHLDDEDMNNIKKTTDQVDGARAMIAMAYAK